MEFPRRKIDENVIIVLFLNCRFTTYIIKNGREGEYSTILLNNAVNIYLLSRYFVRKLFNTNLYNLINYANKIVR